MAIKSDAQRKAVAKYNAQNYEQIQIRVKKGNKDRIKAYAEARGKSLNEYITDLIEADMKDKELQ